MINVEEISLDIVKNNLSVKEAVNKYNISEVYFYKIKNKLTKTKNNLEELSDIGIQVCLKLLQKINPAKIMETKPELGIKLIELITSKIIIDSKNKEENISDNDLKGFLSELSELTKSESQPSEAENN